MGTRIAILGGLLAGSIGACTLDWDTYDPRLGASGGTGGATSSVGGGGSGGSTTSSSSSTGGTGGMGGMGGGGAGLGPWGMAQPVTILDDPNNGEDDPTFTGDGLELYFNRSSDVYQASRASMNDPWDNVSLRGDVSSSFGETNPVVSADGLTFFVGSNRAQDGTGYDIYVYTRMSRNDPWSGETRLTGISTANGDLPSCLSADGLTLILESDVTGEADLYVTTRMSPNDPWETPSPIAELNSTSADRQAWLSPDGLTLYFDSNRSGDTEIYVTTRDALTDPWEPPTPVTELNTIEGDSDAWLSPDMRYIMFTRGPSPLTIYEAFR